MDAGRQFRDITNLKAAGSRREESAEQLPVARGIA